MKDSSHNRLLHDLFAGDELLALRRRSLETGLASLKRKRLHARLAKAALFLPVLLALILVVWPRQQQRAIANKTVSKVTAAGPVQPSTKIISERELFALFPKRPMALVGKPGHQRLVFLDQPNPQID